MTTFCSVRPCSKMRQWRFGHINLCQGHWEQWCRLTWQALVTNVEQPIMEDWVAVVEAGRASDTTSIQWQLLHPNYLAWAPVSLRRYRPPEV